MSSCRLASSRWRIDFERCAMMGQARGPSWRGVPPSTSLRRFSKPRASPRPPTWMAGRCHWPPASPRSWATAAAAGNEASRITGPEAVTFRCTKRMAPPNGGRQPPLVAQSAVRCAPTADRHAIGLAAARNEAIGGRPAASRMLQSPVDAYVYLGMPKMRQGAGYRDRRMSGLRRGWSGREEISPRGGGARTPAPPSEAEGGGSPTQAATRGSRA